ncbi:hypothetical protein Tco_0546179, partial [Tanacetum coccineum]
VLMLCSLFINSVVATEDGHDAVETDNMKYFTEPNDGKPKTRKLAREEANPYRRPCNKANRCDRG